MVQLSESSRAGSDHSFVKCLFMRKPAIIVYCMLSGAIITIELHLWILRPVMCDERHFLQLLLHSVCNVLVDALVWQSSLNRRSWRTLFI